MSPAKPERHTHCAIIGHRSADEARRRTPDFSSHASPRPARERHRPELRTRRVRPFPTGASRRSPSRSQGRCRARRLRGPSLEIGLRALSPRPGRSPRCRRGAGGADHDARLSPLIRQAHARLGRSAPVGRTRTLRHADQCLSLRSSASAGTVAAASPPTSCSAPQPHRNGLPGAVSARGRRLPISSCSRR